MGKKGVSGIVASILLILIVIGIATLVFVFSRGFVKDLTEGSQSDQGLCEQAVFEISATKDPEGDDYLQVNNNGNIKIIGLSVQKIKDSGEIEVEKILQVIEPGKSGINIIYEGDDFDEIKVVAILLIDDKEFICEELYGKEYNF